MEKQRVVVCAAVRLNGFVYLGPRHFDRSMSELMMLDEGNPPDGTEEQGFIDQFGVFMTREEAYEVAKAAGQVKYRCGGDEGRLFSENLY
jgi:hypothetical protein